MICTDLEKWPDWYFAWARNAYCLKVATSQIQIDIQYVFFKQVCKFHQIIYDFQIDFCTVNATIAGHILGMRAVIPNTLHLKRYNTCN